MKTASVLFTHDQLKNIAHSSILTDSFVVYGSNLAANIMTIRILNTIGKRAVLFFTLLLAPALVWAKDVTALELIKEGNRYIGEQAKDKVVQIRSEKSIGGLTPNIWYVVYYDPTASLKAVEVKFGAGKMMDVKRPLRLLEPVTGGDTPMDREKIKIDSDAALKTALAEPLLEKVKVKASSLKLERQKDGSPVWRVRLWAEKLRRPQDDVSIGEVHLSAADGKVVKSDLHINRID